MDHNLSFVKTFLDMTTTYVLSRSWQDLISMYIFRLHPLPHCSTSITYSFLGLTVASSEMLAFLKSLAGVILAGPVLTVMLVWAKGHALRQVSRAGGSSKQLLSLIKQDETTDSELALPRSILEREWFQRHRSASIVEAPPSAARSPSSSSTPDGERAPLPAAPYISS